RYWSVTGVQTCALPILRLELLFLVTKVTSLTLMPPLFSRLAAFALSLSVAAIWLPTPGLTSMTCDSIASALKLFIANWKLWACKIGRAACRERELSRGG